MGKVRREPADNIIALMTLTAQDIAGLAQLARLRPSPEQTERLVGELNAFFDLVQRMQAVDTQGVVPLAHPTSVVREVALRLAQDSATEQVDRQANQRSAPAVQDGLYLVPRVVE